MILPELVAADRNQIQQLAAMRNGIAVAVFAHLMDNEYQRAIDNHTIGEDGKRNLDIDFNTTAHVAVVSADCLLHHLGVVKGSNGHG